MVTTITTNKQHKITLFGDIVLQLSSLVEIPYINLFTLSAVEHTNVVILRERKKKKKKGRKTREYLIHLQANLHFYFDSAGIKILYIRIFAVC